MSLTSYRAAPPRAIDANRGAICRLIQRKPFGFIASPAQTLWVCRAHGILFRVRRGNFLLPRSGKGRLVSGLL